MLEGKEAPMAEEVELLRLVKAFVKIRDRQRRREIVEFVEATVEREACTQTKPER
jgi:hypothetical protein